MIKISNKIVSQEHFPDGSLLLKLDEHPFIFNYNFLGQSTFDKIVTWHYENDSELFTLICLTKYFQEQGLKVILHMPYCPHARMDRVKNREEVFTLKYFCDTINSLNFSEVHILDPHSNVCTALLNNVHVQNPSAYISKAMDKIEDKDLVAFYPDEGAMKRGTDYLSGAYAFGIKKRDWETGKIQGLEIMNKDVVRDRNVLIIDDICSKGGTFYHSAKALKEAGAKNIYLYITHCENSILTGDLITSGLVKKIYTTNSLFTAQHDLIEVIEL